MDELLKPFETITLEEMKSFAENAGLVWITGIDSDTGEEVTPESERILCVVREKDKKVPASMKKGEADDH